MISLRLNPFFFLPYKCKSFLLSPLPPYSSLFRTINQKRPFTSLIFNQQIITQFSLIPSNLNSFCKLYIFRSFSTIFS